MNRLVKRWHLWKLKIRFKKAAKSYNSHTSWMKKDQSRTGKINWISMQSTQYCYIQNCYFSRGWKILAKWAQGCSAENVIPRHTERLTINQEQVRWLQKKQSKNNKTGNDRSTRRAHGCFNSLYKNWLLHCEDWTEERKEMVFSVHMFSYESGDKEVVPKLDIESCLTAIRQLIARRGQPSAIIGDKQIFLLELNGNLRSMLQNGTKKGSDGRSTHHPRLICKEYGSSWWQVAKKTLCAVLGNRSVNKDVHSTMTWIVEQTLNKRLLTSDSSHLIYLEALTPNHSCFGNEKVCLLYLPCAEEFAVHQKLFRKTQVMQISFQRDFVKSTWQL